MDKKIKVIAFHLPQYHSFPENDKWWGEGFTEWTNVKKGKVIYGGQVQPRVPLNNNYYNLLENENLVWQSNLAKDYDIYGFCFYHYWFNGHMLMEKPVENFLRLDSDKKCNYCICWANENWTRAWADKSNETLIQQKYGDEKEWEEHFYYLLPFFKDEKYIYDNGKPIFVIYRPELIYRLRDMLEYWNMLAKKNGIDGICFVYQQYSYYENHGKEEELFSYNIEYQPSYAINQMARPSKTKNFVNKMYELSPNIIQRLATKIRRSISKKQIYNVYDYDEVWNHILTCEPSTTKAIPGAFVDFDNSPRRQERCTYFSGMTTEKFAKYIEKQTVNAIDKYNSEYLFLFAWNEWGESGYLEPDERHKYGLLEAVKNAVSKL